MSEFLPGSIINDRFLTISRLGAGTFGEVYFTYDLKRKMHVAVKINKIPLEVNANVNEYLNQKELKHPNLVKVLEYVGKNKKHENECLIFEYVQGESLDAVIGKKTLMLVEKIKIIAELADCVNYLHKNKIIHNDIKPGNVILSFDKFPKLIDLGTSFKDELNHMHEFSKTIIYGDPRLLNKEIKAPDFQCDIYSFGLTIWEIYAGGFPYFNKQLHQSDKIKTINQLFEYILFKCTTSLVQHRYKNMKELINDLSRWKEITNKSLEKKSDKKDDLFKLGHFEDLFLMARELRKALHEATEGSKIKSNRIDGKFVEKKEKYAHSNDKAYFTFDYEGTVFGINGDTTLEATHSFVDELEKSISFSLMNPEDVLVIEPGEKGERTKLRLRINYDVAGKRYRANGFYCYAL